MAIPRYEDMYGSTYVSPEDFQSGKEIRAVIAEWDARKVWCPGKGENDRVTLALSVDGKMSKKRVVVNKTSAKALAAKWGKDFSKWSGKTVLIRRAEVSGRAAVLITPIDAPSIPETHEDPEPKENQ